MQKDFAVRFWEKVFQTEGAGCWLWQGAASSSGYGVFRVDGKLISAHRMMWLFERGPIPAGEHVLHHCDVRLCVKPAHLFLGSNQDNTDDMLSKKHIGIWRKAARPHWGSPRKT